MVRFALEVASGPEPPDEEGRLYSWLTERLREAEGPWLSGPAEEIVLLAALAAVRAVGSAAVIEAVLDQGAAGAGAVRTPGVVAKLMADLLAIPEKSYPESILDPACGTGAFLIQALDHGSNRVLGQDIAELQIELAAAVLHEPAVAAQDAVLRVGDSLLHDAFRGTAVDGVLCNPPYNVRRWGHDELAYDERWVHGLPARTESELAWVQHSLAHLEAEGLAVLLLPPSVAHRNSGRRIRQSLLRSGSVRAVVALRQGVAAPLHVPLHVWILQKRPIGASATSPVLFIQAADLELTDVPAIWTRFVSTPDTFESIPGVARSVPVVELLDEEADLSPTRHVRTSSPELTPAHAAQSSAAARDQLRSSADELLRLLPLLDKWSLAGDEPKRWRTATVADLLRGGAVSLVEEPEPGDVLLPALVRSRASQARVVENDDEATADSLRGLHVVRPDPDRLDSWFLAGFMGADDNISAASTGSSMIKLDVRKLKVPLMPLADQQRFGQAFRHLAELRRAARETAARAEQTAADLMSATIAGALVPPESPMSTP
ncbi:N-6 DNA methylase [Kineosporia mesophila]|uniref:N-6 DNA methylase n=1 Tax=Kineosporia mesophila TaxID=566012 RepID=UPI001E2EA432|nr:N-6 DNA methylase [Kineosporia mesophila]